MSDTAQDARSVAVALRLRVASEMYRPVYAKAAAGTASPRTAIKAKCLDCSCYQRIEITNCTVYGCPLWLYRPYQTEESE